MTQKVRLIFLTIFILAQGVFSKNSYNINPYKDKDAEPFAKYKKYVKLHRFVNGYERTDDDQTLNMYLQLDDNQKDLLKGLVQRHEDRKCSGDRCGSYERSYAYDIDDVLGEIKKQTNLDRINVRDSDGPDYGYGNEYQPSVGAPYIGYPHVNHVDNNDPGFEDLTRNEYVIKFGPLVPYRIRSDYLPRALTNHDEKENEVNTDNINPEDFFQFYVDTKTKIVTALLQAVRSLSKTLPFTELLSDKQIKLLKSLIFKYDDSLVRKEELEPAITDIVFGEYSNSKILPHDLNTFKIFVPKWFYERIATHKNVRSQRNLLPLTNRQRAKLLSKTKIDSSPIFLSRRNFNPNQFGVPFEMDVQGLGQINP